MMIRAQGLKKRFGRTQVLDGLDLEVPEGAVFALIGANGAGKTTCLKILMNLLEGDGGEARIGGVDSRRIGTAELQQIGYVSENQELPGWMTVEYFLRFLRPFYAQWDEALVEELLRQFDLPVGRKLRNLSRGMQMKASLLSVLAYRPKLLILDEPLSGLDALVRDEFTGAMLERAEGMTILISSHDLGEIESFASHVGYLENGKVAFSEEIGDLGRRFREVEVTLGSTPRLPAQWPREWLAPETGGAMVRFVDSRFDGQRSEAQVRSLFPSASAVEYRPMSLRSIFVSLAKGGRRVAA